MFAAMPGPPNYYASPVPPPRRSNTLPIVLGIGCGGCFLLLILMAAVLLPVFMKARQNARTIASERTAERFLINLRDHQYDEAISLMTPEAQQGLTTAGLQKLAKSYEQRYGPLQAWESTNLHLAFAPGSNQLQLDYQLSYKRGHAQAIFVFNYSGTPRGLTAFDLHSDTGNASHDISK